MQTRMSFEGDEDGWPVTQEEEARHCCAVMRLRRNRRMKGRAGKWADSPESRAWWSAGKGAAG